MRSAIHGTVLAVFTGALTSIGAAVADGQGLTRASVDSHGQEASGYSRKSSVSADGQRVVFSSQATNLVSGDTNGCEDVFLHDRTTGSTVLVSVSAAGGPADGGSFDAVISADGRCVAFASGARNLVAGDTNNRYDVFVRDLVLGTTERVSVDSSGAQGNGDSGYPAISGDGSVVAFWSVASSLVAGDQNGVADVFVRDRASGTTQRASAGDPGVESNGASSGAAISRDGQWVAFWSVATNLVADDTNGASDVFVRGLASEHTVRMSVSPGGDQGDGDSCSPSLSADGRFVAFTSAAGNLVMKDRNRMNDVFVRDRDFDGNGVFDEPLGTLTVRASDAFGGGDADGPSEVPAISADGRWVAFESAADDLVAADGNASRDVFLFDARTHATSRVSTSWLGGEASAASVEPSLSADGRVVGFTSYAANLVPGDQNGLKDVFVRDRFAVVLDGVPGYPNPVRFEIANATGETGHVALVFLSATGTAGFDLPDGRTVPLTYDPCTVLGFQLLPFLSGSIDRDGWAGLPSFRFPEIPPGVTIYAAAVTAKPSNGRILAITDPISFVTR